MNVSVRFWGVARRLAGADQRDLLLAPGADVADLISALHGDAGLAAELDRCAFAIGSELIPRSRVLDDGDEVMVLPPVSGG